MVSVSDSQIFLHSLTDSLCESVPNKEYNVHYENLYEGDLRHGDHRFEWSRDDFKKWTGHVCDAFGYSVEISGIGDTDDEFGTPTQMGVFKKCV